jgi:hypothetical protein
MVCKKIKNACTFDERFERPWQPLKGIYIKNYLTKNFRACGVIDTAYTIFSFENRSYLGEFEAEFKKALARESRAQEVLFDEKNRGSKIS